MTETTDGGSGQKGDDTPVTLTPTERRELRAAWMFAALTALTTPIPPHAFVVIIATAAVSLRWWGVLRGLYAFLLPWAKDGDAPREGVPFHGPVQLNHPQLVLALEHEQLQDAAEETVQRLSAALAKTQGAWIELHGLSDMPLVVGREALARVLTAALMITKPGGDKVKVRVVEVDLAVAGSFARTVVFDGTLWKALITEVLGTENDQRAPMRVGGGA